MVLNQIIMGAASGAVGATGAESCPPRSLEELRAAVVSVLEEYTSLNNWNLRTVTEDADGDTKDQVMEGELSEPYTLSIQHVGTLLF